MNQFQRIQKEKNKKENMKEKKSPNNHKQLGQNVLCRTMHRRWHLLKIESIVFNEKTPKFFSLWLNLIK